MRAVHGTAIYTGGGCYTCIGELDNGLWFCGCNDWCEIIDKDSRSEDENNDLCVFDNDWMDKHVVKDIDRESINKMFQDFCKRLDNSEEHIEDGYSKYSNYMAGEVSRLINFDYFDN